MNLLNEIEQLKEDVKREEDAKLNVEKQVLALQCLLEEVKVESAKSLSRRSDDMKEKDVILTEKLKKELKEKVELVEFMKLEAQRGDEAFVVQEKTILLLQQEIATLKEQLNLKQSEFASLQNTNTVLQTEANQLRGLSQQNQEKSTAL